MSVRVSWFLAALAVVAAVGAVGAADYKAEIEEFGAQQEERLRSETGWLAMDGLFFLTEGDHRFGTGTLNDFVLPEGLAPEEVGVFEYRDGETTVRAIEGTTVAVNGEEVTSAVLTPSVSERGADKVTVGDLTLWVHISGHRKAVRMRNPNSEIRRSFTGRKWFPVDETFQVVARYEPLAEPDPLEVPNVLGDIERFTATAFVRFEIDGQTYSMKGIGSRKGQLWFIFRDLTSGQETYPATRFLASEVPGDGEVVIDFSRAANPPCAFNPYTTCPLPPPENRLNVRKRAGCGVVPRPALRVTVPRYTPVAM